MIQALFKMLTTYNIFDFKNDPTGDSSFYGAFFDDAVKACYPLHEDWTNICKNISDVTHRKRKRFVDFNAIFTLQNWVVLDNQLQRCCTNGTVNVYPEHRRVNIDH